MVEHWRQELSTIWADQPDLVVVPEACDRYPGHTMAERKAYCGIRGNQVRDYFCQEAKAHRCYIAYSAARMLEDGTYRHSTQLISRDGEIVGIYNKNHLVPEETTEGGILCGKEAPVFETDFGRVSFAICFDLNFHELMDKYRASRPGLIVFFSMCHGGIMQNTWAYHCQACLVGAVCGDECTSVNPLGETVVRSTNYIHRVTASINLDYKAIRLDGNWEKMQAAKDTYGRGVSFFDPGHLGVVLMTSEMPDRTAPELVREVQMETWDECYERSMKHRHIPENMEP